MAVARTNSVPGNKLNLRIKLVNRAFFSNNTLVSVDSQLHSLKMFTNFILRVFSFL